MEIWMIVAISIAIALVAFRLLRAKRVPGGAGVQEKIENGALVLDVRSPAEYASGHFPRAQNIPVNDLHSRFHEIESKDRPIIVYCASGMRSALARRILKSAGFSDVTNAGGLKNMPQTHV